MSATAPGAGQRPATGPTKGERTRARILDAAELQFAARGFEAASLRDIAREAGIRQPGLYNHFASKQELYAAVLDRALGPMADVLEQHLARDADGPAFGELPLVMTDLLAEHPPVAALFQDALRGDPESPGVRILQAWLDRLFTQGAAAARAAGVSRIDRAELAIRIIAMFNVCTGYFLSQRAFESMATGRLTDPRNLARQKRLLARMVGATSAGGR